MKTLEATTQIGGFNQRLPMRKSNNRFPCIGPHRHEDDAIDTFFSSVKSHDETTAVKLVVGIKTLITDVYAIQSKSVLNISQFLQDWFRACRITIIIWSQAQEEIMGSVRKLLRAFALVKN